MTDLEDLLRESLRADADRIEPSPPPALAMAATTIDHRRALGIAAAIVLIVGAVAGAWWVRDSRGDRGVAVSPAVEGVWSEVSSPLSPRQFPWVLWTGQEFIVWGGVRGNTGLSDGALYNPATDSWRPMEDESNVRPGAAAVWAGDRMVVVSQRSAYAYDPATDMWSLLGALAPATAAGFTDVIWTGTDLLGIGVQRDDSGNSATLSAWRLDGAEWVLEDSAVADAGLPTVRYMTTADQVDVHNPVALTDGFTLWDGQYDGWRFTIGTGWTRLPSVDAYDGDTLVSSGQLAAVDGELYVVAQGLVAEGDDTRIARFDGGGWSPWQVVQERAVLGARVVSAGDQILVVGANPLADGPLLRIEPVAGTSTPVSGYPIDTVIDQGLGWSGTQFLVAGGQRSVTTVETSTGDTSTVSAAAALWTPSP